MKNQVVLNPGGLAAVALLVLLSSYEIALGQWTIPDELQKQASVLTEPQLDFIRSGKVLEFIPERQLEHELATRDAQSLSTLFNDLMSLADEMSYDPEQDMGAAPLNLESKYFNRSNLPTLAPLRKHEREPGPFSVSRYMYPTSGVSTFGGAKVAIFPEDLTAGDVDVAIIGVPNNMGSGRRDAGMAPDEMRAHNSIATADLQSLVQPFDVLNVVDYGNFSIDGLSIERTVGHVTAMVAETSRTGAIPMLVGGDTSMLYPGVKGVAQAQGDEAFGLLHFSAHPDAERSGDHTISDKQAMFMLLEQNIVDGSNTIQVGLRGAGVDADTLRWLRSKKVKYHTMAEIQHRGVEKVLKQVLREVKKGPDTFFVSVDVSVIDPGEMIAAGRVESNGMRLQQVTQVIRHVCAAKEIVGFEITDMAPMLDLSRLSVVNANAMLNACLVGVAVRKAGLDADYINPLVLTHGQ